MKDSTAPAVDQQRLVRHCCGSCIYNATGKDGGWGRFVLSENPRKTDWCALCDHRAEGVEMPVYRHKWGGFRILPNAEISEPAAARDGNENTKATLADKGSPASTGSTNL